MTKPIEELLSAALDVEEKAAEHQKGEWGESVPDWAADAYSFQAGAREVASRLVPVIRELIRQRNSWREIHFDGCSSILVAKDDDDAIRSILQTSRTAEPLEKAGSKDA